GRTGTGCGRTPRTGSSGRSARRPGRTPRPRSRARRTARGAFRGRGLRAEGRGFRGRRRSGVRGLSSAGAGGGPTGAARGGAPAGVGEGGAAALAGGGADGGGRLPVLGRLDVLGPERPGLALDRPRGVDRATDLLVPEDAVAAGPFDQTVALADPADEPPG